MILTKENIEQIDLDKLYLDKIESGSASQLLLIVPTNRKARNIKKEIISSTPNKYANNINVETLGTLASKLLKVSTPYRQLSEAASTVFIKQAAQQSKLRYFSVYKKELPTGTLEKIKNVITEYKLHGIDPAQLRNEAKKLDKTEKNKAYDIADIYQNYLDKCTSLNAYDLGDIYRELNRLSFPLFDANFKKLYNDVDLIIVNGFDEFTSPEIQILNNLSSLHINFYINFDYGDNKFLFEHLDKCYKKLYECGFRTVKDVGELSLKKFNKTIRDHLFKNYSVKKKLNFEDQIFKIAANDRENEIDLIAKEIKRLIIEENVKPNQICVAFNLIQNYSVIVRDLFSKYGLAFNLTDRTSLDNSNPVSAVVNFIEIIENGFYYNNILRALSSGYIKTDIFDFSNLYRVSSDLKIVSGRNNWINTLNDAINNLNNNRDDDSDESDKLRESYTKALNDINQLDLLLKPFEGKNTIPNFKKKLYQFINQTELPFILLRSNQNQEENVRSFSEFIETIDEVFDLLEDEHGSTTEFNLHFFMDQLRTICSWARFNVKEKSNYGVQVTSFEEIRGLKYDYLFIGGLCDGDFPTRFMPQIFFSGSYKKQNATHYSEERNRFYQALSVWNKKLYLSYPLTDSGRELVVSTFVKDFENLFNISELSEINFSDSLFSREELELYSVNVMNNGDQTEIEKLKKTVYNDYDEVFEAIDTEKMRELNPFAESPFTGYLINNSKESNLSHNSINHLKKIADKQYSVSQLETYSKCPFKFFVERVLNIQAIEEPSEDIEAKEMGRILHSVLYQFYTFIRDNNIDLILADKKNFKKLQEIIYKIAEEHISQGLFNSPINFYEKEKLLGIDGNKNESILSRFIEYECENNDEYNPKYFEVGFGSLRESGSDNIISDKEPINIDGLKLRGKIDRIEISKEGDSFNIVDYKLSGKKPSFKELKNGISLQLPVYLFAAKELLKRKFNKDFTPNEMFIYSLKYAKDEFGKNKVSLGRGDDKLTTDELVKLTLEHIHNFIESISKGCFGLSPHDNREEIVCRYCQFKSVCRIQEVIK